MGAPHRGAGGLQLQDDSRGVLELAGGSVAARVPVEGTALTPCSRGDPCFGLRDWAQAGRGQGLELGGGGGAQGGLPTGAQLLLLLLDDELLLLLRWWLRLHRLRRLLHELGGLQRGIGCEDSNGDRDPPSSPVPQPQGTHPQEAAAHSVFVPSGALGQSALLLLLMWEAALRLSRGKGGRSQILGAMPVQHPRLLHSMSPLAHTLTAPAPCTPQDSGILWVLRPSWAGPLPVRGWTHKVPNTGM